jgi:predicted RNA methylase
MAALDRSDLEARRQVEQQRLDDMKDQAERNRLGQFATPPNLASAIMRAAINQLDTSAPVRFLEPSIGSGAFVSALLRMCSPAPQRIVGIELDPAFAALASELWVNEGVEIRNDNYLRFVDECEAETFNLLVANPPYVRHHHLSSSDKMKIKQLLGSQGFDVSGLAGLYSSFLLLSDRLLAPGAVSAWLIPSEFMDVNYGTAIKQYLTTRVTLNRIHRFDPSDVQFGDALVSSAVVIFTKERPPEGTTAAFTYGGSLSDPAVSQEVALAELTNVRKWTRLPAHPVESLRDSGPTLGDLFKISRGIATGANKTFILDRALANDLKLPTEYLKPILPSPRHVRIDRIDADENGFPLIDRQLVVIDCELPEKEVQSRHPALWAYLEMAKEDGIHDKYLPSKRRPWYRQEQRSVPLFFCTYMGRGVDLEKPFRLIWNRSQAIATNMYLMLYPTPDLSKALACDHDLEERVAKALMNLTGEEMRNAGRVYGGGLHKIEPRELALMPIRELADVVDLVSNEDQLQLSL